jgi:hypothetical protein
MTLPSTNGHTTGILMKQMGLFPGKPLLHGQTTRVSFGFLEATVEQLMGTALPVDISMTYGGMIH